MPMAIVRLENSHGTDFAAQASLLFAQYCIGQPSPSAEVPISPSHIGCNFDFFRTGQQYQNKRLLPQWPAITSHAFILDEFA